VKLFGAQRRRETAKPLQFLELIKATFDCGGNTTQQSAGVRRGGHIWCLKHVEAIKLHILLYLAGSLLSLKIQKFLQVQYI
jgi:hypothetical protein